MSLFSHPVAIDNPLVCRAFAGSWYPVDNGDTVLVIGRIEVALVADEHITVVQGERAGFVLGSF